MRSLIAKTASSVAVILVMPLKAGEEDVGLIPTVARLPLPS